MILNLKHINIFKTAVSFMAAVMLVSCVGLEEEQLPDVGLQRYPILLNVMPDTDTKIALQDNTMMWEETDTIQLTAVTSGIEVADIIGVAELKYSGIVDDDPSQATFTGFITLRNYPRECYFTYPSGNRMSVNASSGVVTAIYTMQDGTHKPFLYGKSEYPDDPSAGMDVSLHHMGAVLELDVNVEGVTKISFIGNKLEKLSPISIKTEDQSLILPTEAVTQITVPVQKNGKTYLFVPPVCLDKGFTLICSNDDGTRHFMKSYSSGVDGSYDFSDKAGVKIPIVINGEFHQFSVTVTDVDVTHQKTAEGLLTGSLASFVMNMTGTSNKLVEAWGADLYNSEGLKVRSISGTIIPNGKVDMGVENDLPLLKAGEYYLAPYYQMFGQLVSLDTYTYNVTDSKAFIKVEGTTSYDKYLAGNISGTNSANDTGKRLTIENLRVTTNVDLSVMQNYNASLGGTSLGEIRSLTTEDGVMTAVYDDQTRNTYGNYPIAASFDVGNWHFSASKDCHVTGLPFDINFQTSSLYNGWTHNNVKIEKSHYHFANGSSSAISPSFHIPDNMEVKVSLTGWAYQGWTSSSSTVYINATQKESQQSGVSHSFSMDSWNTNPSNQKGETMSGKIEMSESENKISIFCITNKGSGIPGISVGLYAKAFKVEYVD